MDTQAGQAVGALLGNTSLSVKLICIVVFICYFLSFSEAAVRVLTLTPGYVSPPTFWIWTVFTHCFVEFHIWQVGVDLITVGLCGKLIEPLWGTWEMMNFFAIVNVAVAIVGWFFYLAIYMATFNTDVLFEVHIHGLAGYIAAVSVAVKQLMPDHVVVKTPVGKITNRNVPLCVSLFSIIIYLIGLLEGTYPTMFISGVLVGWIYLRFYQRHSNGSRGDMASNFTFASFFPTVLQPAIEMFSGWVYTVLVKLGICRKTVRKFDVGAPTSITISLPGSESQDAERRRQIALKALSERLSKVESPTSWPSMEETLPKPGEATTSTAPDTTTSSSNSATEASTTSAVV
nr:EOG090X06Q3 [Eulimnadia texana]